MDSDDSNSPVTGTFTVTVTDTDLALTKVPTDITVDATSSQGAVVTYTAPTATDEDGSSPPVTCSPASGSTFAIGTTTVTCTASDSGDTNSPVSARFKVTVNDTDLGLINVPADISVNATSAQGAVVTYTAPTATDDGGEAPSVSCTSASGSTFPIGATKVTCTANDSDDTPGTVSGSFTVMVVDTLLPSLQLPSSPVTANATSPHGATVNYSVTATDPVYPASQLTIVCSPNSGSTFPIGTTTVTCSVSDPVGNSARGSFQVLVQGAAIQVTTQISAVQGLPIAHRIQSRLVAQLQAVQTAIQANKTAQACRDLTGYINHVKAQRGKGLTTAQANQLLAAATNIKKALAC